VSAQLVLQADVDAFVQLLAPRLEKFVEQLAAAKREVGELSARPRGTTDEQFLTARNREIGLRQQMEMAIEHAIHVTLDRVRARAGKAANREQFEAEMMAAPAVQEMLRELAG
jgi:hypothetical protein